MDNIQNTNEPEVIEAQPEEVTPEVTEAVLGDMLQHEPEPEHKAETVGLDKFLDIKKQNKELKKEMDKLKSQIENGDDVSNVDIDEIADEYGVDKGFLKKFEASIRSQMNNDFEAKVSEKLKPLEQAEKAKQANQTFESIYNQTLERMPEYANLIDKDSLRTLAFQKENAALSLPQLVEKIYGRSLSGKKTIETTTPRGGKDPQEIDFKLARTDAQYFSDIMADPAMKAKYNQNIESRLDL
jgi:hypothetical protein